MILSEKQHLFLQSPIARINLLEGSVSSGKTFILNWKWFAYILSCPRGSKFLMSGKTRETLHRNVLDDFVNDCIGGWDKVYYNQQSGVLKFWGYTIYCSGANTKEEYKKIKGLTIQGWYADEITEHPENFVTMALTRCRKGKGASFWSCNPDTPFHFINTEYILNKIMIAQGWLNHWQFNPNDNPSLSREYKLSLKHMYKGLWYLRLVKGLWVLAEGTIYGDYWSDELLQKEIPFKPDGYYIGCDYATTAPFVLGLWANRGLDFHRMREYYYDPAVSGFKKTDAMLAKDIQKFIMTGGVPIRSLILPPDANSLELEVRGLMPGLNIVTAIDDVVPGIRCVSTLMAEKHITIDPDFNKGFLTEKDTYIWCPQAQKMGKDEPVKANDHAVDECRYTIFTVLRGEQPYQTVFYQRNLLPGMDVYKLRR